MNKQNKNIRNIIVTASIIITLSALVYAYRNRSQDLAIGIDYNVAQSGGRERIEELFSRDLFDDTDPLLWVGGGVFQPQISSISPQPVGRGEEFKVTGYFFMQPGSVETYYKNKVEITNPRTRKTVEVNPIYPDFGNNNVQYLQFRIPDSSILNDTIGNEDFVLKVQAWYKRKGRLNRWVWGKYSYIVSKPLTMKIRQTSLPFSADLKMRLSNSGDYADSGKGPAPLYGVSLKATVNGAGIGDITYKFWCNIRNSSPTLVETVRPSQTLDVREKLNLCDYDEPGRYYARVEVTNKSRVTGETIPVDIQ